MPQPLIPIAILLIPSIGGTLWTYVYDDDGPFVWRLCAGACTGMAAYSLVAFLLACGLGMTPSAVIGALAIAAGPMGLLAMPSVRCAVFADLRGVGAAATAAVRDAPGRTVTRLVVVSLVALLIGVVLDRVMFERADGIYTGVMNNYGDLPFHVGVITRFADGGNVPPESPIYAGTSFTYPFLADFFAALIVKTGSTLRLAMMAQNAVLTLALVGLLYRWAYELSGDRLAARIAPMLTLFNGGLGWLLVFGDARGSATGLLEAIRHPAHDYTIMNGTAWRWGNVVTSLLVTQRSLLFGLPIALVVFTLLWRAIREETAAASAVTRRLCAAGLIAGLLPLVHAHSYLVVVGIAASLALMFGPWRAWAAFFVPAIALAAVQILWSAHSSATRPASLLGWHFGWDRGEDNVLWFWFKNTGLLIPLIVAAFAWSDSRNRLPRTARFFYLPFTLCFLIPNVIRLAPWIWDNIKVLVYWHVASAPFVGLVLAQLWRRDTRGRAISLAIACSLMMAGALDVWRVVSHTSEVRVFNRDGIEFADAIRADTPPQALILHAPIQNHPVFLTGRRSLMGYPGHVWSHGLDWRTRDADIKAIYAGGTDTQALLVKYGIDYVVVGPPERRMGASERFFDRFPTVRDAGEYRLYRIATDTP